MILDEIAAKTVERINDIKQSVTLEEIKDAALKKEKSGHLFRKALSNDGISFICEVKKASPSKGIIAENFPYVDIAGEYEDAGADAISVLTEPFYFKGNNDYLKEIAENVSIPILRKDFVVDEYMIYEAHLLGASAVLLICAILDDGQLREYKKIADRLGLDALFEAHDENEISRAVNAGAQIIGVNNRNLKDFTVDINNSVRLRELVPDNILFVSESGMKTPEDIKHLKENGTDAVLIGEAFMRSSNKKEMLERMKG